MKKRILSTPLKQEELNQLRLGDVFYLSGTLVTARDSAHKRRVLEGVVPNVSFTNGAVFHAGPIVKDNGDGTYQMVSIGPTTSMRMEKHEKEFLEITGTKLLIGKGGMGEKTTKACQALGVVHAVFPGGCAVVAADAVEQITSVEWLEELGMPEALWVMKVKEFGPLIVSIDTLGNNLFEQNKITFRKNKEDALKNNPY